MKVKKSDFGTFLVADEESILEFDKLSDDIFEIAIKKAGDIESHRRFFRLIDKAMLHLKFDDTKEQRLRLRNDITILAGHFSVVQKYDGSKVAIPKSLNFNSFSDDQRKMFLDRATNAVWSKIFKSSSMELLRDLMGV